MSATNSTNPSGPRRPGPSAADRDVGASHDPAPLTLGNLHQQSPRFLAAYAIYILAVVGVATWVTYSALTMAPTVEQTVLGWIPLGWVPGPGVITVWCLGLLFLAAVPIYPLTGLIVYVALIYGLRRFSPNLEYGLIHGVPEWICGLSLLGCGVRIVGGPRPPVSPTRWCTWVMLALVGWSLLSTGWAVSHGGPWPPELKHHPVRFVNAAVLFLIASHFVANRQDIWRLACALLVVATVRSLMTPELLGEHDLAGFIATVLPLGVMAIFTTPNRLAGIGMGLMSANLIWVLWNIQNRGAGLAVVAAMITLWIVSWRKGTYLLLSVPTLIVGAVTLRNSSYIQRYVEAWRSGFDAGSGGSRYLLWKSAVEMARDHWLIGVGPSNSAIMVTEYSARTSEKALHNNFLVMLAEQGVVGLLLYVVLFIGTAILLRHVGRLWKREWPTPEARALCAGLIAYLIVGCFLTRHDEALAYILVGLGAAMLPHAKAAGKLIPPEERATDPTTPPPLQDAQLPTAPAPPHARHFAIITAVFSLLLVYGALVPFHFHWVPISAAIEQFRALPFIPTATGTGRIDWSINFMLTIPITTFGMGALLVDRQHRMYAIPAALFVLVTCTILSAGVEFAQIWFSGRVPSGTDVLAQILGAITGITLWLTAGRRLTNWLRTYAQLRQPAEKIDWMLQAYVVGLILYSLAPMDFMLNLGDLWHKYRDGRIELIPFTYVYPSIASMLYSFATEIVLFIPVGMCSTVAWNPRGTRLRSENQSLLLAGLVVLAIELMQLLVNSRYTSSTDLLLGTIGAYIGIRVMYVWRQTTTPEVAALPKTSPTNTLPIWIGLTLLYAGFLATLFWSPFDFTRDSALIKSRIASFMSVPFARMQGGSHLVGLFGIVRKTLWFVPLGVLAANCALHAPVSRTVRYWLYALGCVFLACVALMVEAGQILLPSAVADITDVLLFAGSGMVALALTATILRPAPHTAVETELRTPETETDRREQPSAAPPSGTIRGLDGLRALACLAVFGVHLQQMTGVTGEWGPIDLKRLLLNGNSGVALFFTLSGFLLALPLWSNPVGTRASATLHLFGRKRIGRIVPAYFLCLTALVVMKQQWQSAGELLDTTLHYLFLNNWTEATFYSMNAPFWTIAEQAQFYVIFAGLIWLLHRTCCLTNNRLLTVFTVLCVGCYCGHAWLVSSIAHTTTGQLGSVVTRSILAHLPLFFFGVLAAWFFVNQKQRTPRLNPLVCDILFFTCAALAFAMLATPWDDVFQVLHGRYNLPYLPLLLAAMIVAAPQSAVALRILEFAPLRLLGVISYGIYVYHRPCLGVVRRVMGIVGTAPQHHPVVFAGVGLTFSIIVAALSYVLIESVILKRLKHAVPANRA